MNLKNIIYFASVAIGFIAGLYAVVCGLLAIWEGIGTDSLRTFFKGGLYLITGTSATFLIILAGGYLASKV